MVYICIALVKNVSIKFLPTLLPFTIVLGALVSKFHILLQYQEDQSEDQHESKPKYCNEHQTKHDVIITMRPLNITL